MSDLERSTPEAGGPSPGVSPDQIAALLRRLTQGFGGTPEAILPDEASDSTATAQDRGKPAVTEATKQADLAQLTAAERKREADIIRNYGTLDKAHRVATAHVNGMIPLPPPEQCIVRPYRTVDLDIDAINGLVERETGGGVQIDIVDLKEDECGLFCFGLRVPVYVVTTEGIRPAGGWFDDIDEAQMVAAQGDDWAAFARQHGIILNPDLTVTNTEDYEPTIINCPVE